MGLNHHIVGSDASSRELVSEQDYTAGRPAGVADLLGGWRPALLVGEAKQC